MVGAVLIHKKLLILLSLHLSGYIRTLLRINHLPKEECRPLKNTHKKDVHTTFKLQALLYSSKNTICLAVTTKLYENNKMKKMIIIGATILSAVAFAELPYTFTAGTPAKASEVNQNFNALDSNIGSVESRVKTLEKFTCAYASQQSHKVTYQAKSSTLGQIIILNDKKYRIVEVPFREFSSGDLYKIRLPVKEVTSKYAPSYVSGRLSTGHSNGHNDCSSLTISGFPAQLFFNESRNISFSNESGQSGAEIEFESTLGASISGSIRIGETNVSFYFTDTKSETTSTSTTTDDYDFTDNFEIDNMVHDNKIISPLDDLLDYIQITKVE